MSSAAAHAYARDANTTSSPRNIEAQDLLKAANKLQAIVSNENATTEQISEALTFNRKLWSIFLGDVLRDENQQPLEVRRNIASIGIFVLSQTMALQISPQVEHIKPLIEINRNLAAGLSGRA